MKQRATDDYIASLLKRIAELEAEKEGTDWRIEIQTKRIGELEEIIRELISHDSKD